MAHLIFYANRLIKAGTVLSAFCFLLILATPVIPAAGQSLSGYERSLGCQMLELTKQDIKKNYYDPAIRGYDLDANFKVADEQITSAKTLSEIFGIIGTAVTAIDDSHTFFIPPPMTHVVDYGWHMKVFGDTCYVVAVRPGSDAEKKGMKVGDRVVEVDGIVLTRGNLWKMKYAYRVMPRVGMSVVLQSPDGSQRKLEALAKVELDPRVTAMSRYDYYIHTVREIQAEARLYEHRYYQAQDVVIWKMPDFDFPDTGVRDIVGKMRKSKAVILDLRGNPGGIVKTLQTFVGYFFDHDVRIAELKGRKEKAPIVGKSQGKDSFPGKLIVLVDSGSASAAEVFARVVQLEKRGTVIGDRTAGAVMQAKFFEHEGGANNAISYGSFIANADLIMVDGASLERVGVTPDELMLPGATELATNHDPVLTRAARLAGMDLAPDKAGAMFPVVWPK
ncbi:MAG TPA: S41 family peptidase [Pyrinomonadaceae bacterium]|nr:S41 family peptidase [Pyrinomonadaceae bacterium]